MYHHLPLLLGLATAPAYAADWYAGTSSFVPPSGSFWDSNACYSDAPHYRYVSHASFTFSAENVASISNYNNGAHGTGSGCEGKHAHVTIDQTMVSAEGADDFSARNVYTSAPDPKVDREDDGGLFDSRKEEAEVTVLGDVQAGVTYYMEVEWEDLRTGDPADVGYLEVNVAMSAFGVIDYNNCQNAYGPQLSEEYGPTPGSY